MGWLSMPLSSMDGHRSAKAYLDAQFTYSGENEGGGRRGLTVLASRCPGNRVYYAAAQPHGTDDDAVFAIICLVRWNPRASDGYVFGYKDMTEHMGPCETACPQAILDLLGPTDHEYALAWRKRCRDNLARRERPITDGMRVRLAEPLRFTDGHEGDEFVVVKRGGRLAFRAPSSSALYRISHFRTRDWMVIAETVIHPVSFSSRAQQEARR